MTTNPLFNDNKLKLGLFGLNVSNGCAITTAEGALETSWPTMRDIARIADRDGYETLVPVARWRGFGGETNFNGSNFETYTWAAGLAEATSDTCVMTTSHVPTVHPILAAKQGTTIDHISGGRFALNVVCGWFRPELEMFGASLMEHEVRYEYAAEWIEILKMLWTREDEFDFDGKFLQVRKGFSMPKPIQRPMPPIMNAGGSKTGQHFAAKYADMAFLQMPSHAHEDIKRQADAYRRLAFDEYKRELQLWSYAYVVQCDTQREAEDYLNYYVVERGDDAAVDNLAKIFLTETEILPAEVIEQFKFHFKAGWGGYPLVGTADQIAQRLIDLQKTTGLNGMLLSWVDYRDGLERFSRDVLPLLQQAGLRSPVRAHSGAG